MKLFLAFLMSMVASVCLAALPPNITGKMIHEYPNNPNPSFSLMVLEDPGNGAYNQSTIGQIAAVISSSGIISNGTVIMSNLSVTYITNFLEFSTNLYVTTNFVDNSFVTNLFVTTNNVFVSYITNLFVDNSVTTNAYITNLTVNNVTNNTFITTNLTINQPGGATNLNLVPLSLMYSDVNDAESSLPNAVGVLTNNGSGAIGFSLSLSLDELDILNGYITNFFTGLTNYGVLGTDGNGLLTIGSSTITNISITNAFIQNLTNNTFVNTNVFISTSNAYFNSFYATNAYITTNFSTNLYFVSGKGNTLIITNISVEGVQTNKNIAASSAVITKSDQVLTNAVNALGAMTNSSTGPPSFGLVANNLLQNSSITIQGSAVSLGGTTLAAGSSPFFNLANSTNLTYQYDTNSIPSSGALTFGHAYFTNLQASVTLPAFTLGSSAYYESLVICVTNSTGSTTTLTMPSGVKVAVANGGGNLIYCTNGTRTMVFVDHYGTVLTNAWKNDF